MASPKHIPVTPDALLRRVTLCESTGCWLWNGYRDPDGYGRLNVHGKHWKAPNFYFRFFRPHYPVGKLHILHECDRRQCCNPWHLFLGTHQENIADSVSKGRFTRGEKLWHSKLTESQVIEIRLSEEHPRVLAKRFGMKPYSICWVITGERWKHLPFAHEVKPEFRRKFKVPRRQFRAPESLDDTSRTVKDILKAAL